MKEEDIKYFKKEKETKNPIFFARFPGLNYSGLKILDLGCGHGALSIDLALKGASKVIGIDINSNRVNFAISNLNTHYTNLKERVTFKNIPLNELPENNFDIIVSKASFEHIIDLENLMVEIEEKLKLGGKLLTGFGPLYNCPWGDHRRLGNHLPWMHLILGQNHYIKKLNDKSIKSIYNLGLNGYSLRKYKEIFNTTKGLSVIDFRTNVSNKFSMKLFNAFTFIPILREYFTYNIYCVLERIG